MCVCLIMPDSLWPMDCSLPDSSVHGISQARILEWVAISHSRGSFWPRDQTRVSCISCSGRWILYHDSTWEAWLRAEAMALLSTFSITDFASSVSISSSYLPHLSLAKRGFPDSSVGKDSACNARDPSSIPGSGRYTGERIDYLYSWASLAAQLVKMHL